MLNYDIYNIYIYYRCTYIHVNRGTCCCILAASSLVRFQSEMRSSARLLLKQPVTMVSYHGNIYRNFSPRSRPSSLFFPEYFFFLFLPSYLPPLFPIYKSLICFLPPGPVSFPWPCFLPPGLVSFPWHCFPPAGPLSLPWVCFLPLALFPSPLPCFSPHGPVSFPMRNYMRYVMHLKSVSKPSPTMNFGTRRFRLDPDLSFYKTWLFLSWVSLIHAKKSIIKFAYQVLYIKLLQYKSLICSSSEQT